MYSALYFPHTEVRSTQLVKTALLTWDHLETIIPFPGFRPHYEGTLAQAMELIGRPRAPSDGDKTKVHALVTELVDQDLPETFSYRPERWEDVYEMWAQKLSPRTWDLLVERGLVGHRLENTDFPASQPAGLTLMSILADVLAGETRTRVTDRAGAYATIANVPRVAPETRGASTFEQVVPLTFKTIAVEQFPIEALIALREREQKERFGADYRRLRHNYLDRIHAHVQKAAKYAPGSADRIELDRQFEQAMEDDLRDLKNELGVARWDAILSKESMTLVGLGAVALGAAQLAAVPMAIAGAVKATGGLATVGGGVSMFRKYGQARRKALAGHPMAYLYELDHHHR